MAFIRYTTVEGKRYYQVVRSYREGGKPRQEVLCHLGVHDSLEKAIEHRRREIDVQRKVISNLRTIFYLRTGQILRKIPSQAELERRRQGIGERLAADAVDLLLFAPHERYEEERKRIDKIKDLDFENEIRAHIRQKDELVKVHQAKLNKLIEIQQSYGDLKYKGTGSNLDRPD